MVEKIKTWTLRFPTKENPNIEKALFNWLIVLSYDVKAKYRLISRKFSGNATGGISFPLQKMLRLSENRTYFIWDQLFRVLYSLSWVSID